MFKNLKLFVFALLACCLMLTSCAEEKIYIVDIDKKVDIYFLGLDEADCIVIHAGKQTYIIDTGEKKDLEVILKHLKEFKIKEIEAIILTHPDKDHIGNATEIIKKYSVKQIYQTYYDKGSSLQKELDLIIDSSNVLNEVVKDFVKFGNERIDITIFPPLENAMNSNDSSLVVLVEVNTINFLIPGDIEEAGIQNFLKYGLKSIDVLKAPHHGRNNELSIQLYETINPDYIVVTAAELNKNLQNVVSDKKIYYTTDKEVHFMTDGINLFAK